MLDQQLLIGTVFLAGLASFPDYSNLFWYFE